MIMQNSRFELFEFVVVYGVPKGSVHLAMIEVAGRDQSGISQSLDDVLDSSSCPKWKLNPPLLEGIVDPC